MAERWFVDVPSGSVVVVAVWGGLVGRIVWLHLKAVLLLLCWVLPSPEPLLFPPVADPLLLMMSRHHILHPSHMTALGTEGQVIEWRSVWYFEPGGLAGWCQWQLSLLCTHGGDGALEELDEGFTFHFFALGRNSGIYQFPKFARR